MNKFSHSIPLRIFGFLYQHDQFIQWHVYPHATELSTNLGSSIDYGGEQVGPFEWIRDMSGVLGEISCYCVGETLCENSESIKGVLDQSKN